MNAVRGLIRRVVYPAGTRVSGKDRGEWVKLTDAEVEYLFLLTARAPAKDGMAALYSKLGYERNRRRGS